MTESNDHEDHGGEQQPPQGPARRIWDPDTKRWVSPEELEAGSSPAPDPEPHPIPPSEPPEAIPAAQEPVAAPPVPRPQPGPAPSRRAGPTIVLALIAGAISGLVVVGVALAIGALPGTGSPPEPTPAARIALAGPELAATGRPWVVSVVGGPQDGSGIVLRPEGVIVTSASVVAGAQDVTVGLPAGQSMPGVVVGSDPRTDIAVVRVEGFDLAAGVLGSAAALELADPVVAIGLDAALKPRSASVSVAALGASVQLNGQAVHDTVVLDRAVGAPGGAVIGPGGSVVGMVAASGAHAVPAELVRFVADHLAAGRTPPRPWAGLSVELLDEETGFRLGIDRALVIVADPQGPAAAAGLRRADIVVAVAGRPVDGSLTLLRRTLEAGVGGQLPLTVQRGEQRIDVNVEVAERPG